MHVLIILQGYLVPCKICGIALNNSEQLLGGSWYKATLLVIYHDLANTITHRMYLSMVAYNSMDNVYIPLLW